MYQEPLRDDAAYGECAVHALNTGSARLAGDYNDRNPPPVSQRSTITTSAAHWRPLTGCMNKRQHPRRFVFYLIHQTIASMQDQLTRA